VFSEECEAARIYSSVKYCLGKQIDKIAKMYLINPLSDTDSEFIDFKNAYGNDTEFVVFKGSSIKDMVQELNNELDSRRKTEISHKPIFIFINSMQRLRNLRSENDTELLSFILDKLLCDGPEFGIFFVLHFDSLTTFKRTALKMSNFVHRIAFQMNSESYYEINGSYKNAALKENRAMYYNDELGNVIILKPYELNNN
jgi:hypothetical protein